MKQPTKQTTKQPNSIEPQADASAEERKQQIKRAALKVFARRGISGTKMSAIAEEAGISQGLSYRYFSSKEQIFTLLVEEAIAEAQAAVGAVRQLPGSPKEQLRAFTERMLDESHQHYFLLIQHAGTAEEAPAEAKRLMERFSPDDTLDRLVPILTQGQQLGEFCAGDPRQLLFLYLSVISGLMLQPLPADQGSWQQHVDILMKMLAP